MNKRKQGFTLIELLVVVLIIGILAAVALPQYQKAVVKARFANLKNLTESILKAEEIYYLANNKYTSNFEELDIELNATKTSSSTRTFDWGTCFLYYADQVAYFNCKNNDIGMTYQVYGAFSKSSDSDKLCVSGNKNEKSPQYQVCKNETQSTAYCNDTYCSFYYKF